ncbi:MAG: hypothetical protein IT558_05695 [Alphaproteobacteria bacterium]|nr:hypothetical protein [Alphaproteobacteria bacterium]
MSFALGIILDLLVLGFLGVTIYYAVKLTNSLNAFRDTRAEFNAIMQQLTRNIHEATGAVENLKATSRQSGQELQNMINKSRMMADELHLMNETGDSLANRLEKIAEKARRIAQGLDVPVEEDDVQDDEPAVARPMPSSAPKAGFAIVDRDFEEGLREPGNENPGFSSQAEKDLFEALQKTQKLGRGAF